jgi:hypothetical protein
MNAARSIAQLLAACCPLLLSADDAPKLELHVVPVPIRSYRLLAMSMDTEGFIWTGSIHRTIHRYDPRSGSIESFPLPYDAVASSCLCAGHKVYILGQAYPRLIIYDRSAKTFAELPYPSPNPDVWYGTEAIDGRHLLLFDRNAGLIKWDTENDSGEVLPYPYAGPKPLGGRYDPRDNALWCQIFDLAGGQYLPLAMARFDVASSKFTGYYPYPKNDDTLQPYADPDKTFFVPLTLQGKLVPFDFKENRWCQFLDVPEYGKRFGFIGLQTQHKGQWYFSLSTYNGTTAGCDGQPYHFCNSILQFNPHTRRFDFLTLDAPDAYYQIAYTLTAHNQFFATASNIREADGHLNQARQGEVIFWQTIRPASK